MNMHVTNLTPTQQKAVQRRGAFLASIAEKAAELADRRTRISLTAIPTAALETPLVHTPAVTVTATDVEIQPSGANWFVILASDPIKRSHPSILEIQKAVAKHYGVKVSDILASRRTASIVRPRQVAMLLCKDLTPHSLPQIGRRFGGRDHTTVLHAIRVTSARALGDAVLAHDIAILTEAITGVQQ